MKLEWYLCTGESILQKLLDTNETQSYEKIISTPSGSDIVQDNGDHHENSDREGHGIPGEAEGHHPFQDGHSFSD